MRMQDCQEKTPLKDLGVDGRTGPIFKMRYGVRTRSNNEDEPSDYINEK